MAAQLVEDSLGAVFTRDGVEVRVVRDVTLGAHDCVVESAVGVVDARIDERLDNARDAMLEAHDEASATESVEVDT